MENMEFNVLVIRNNGVIEGLCLESQNPELKNELFFKHSIENETDFFNKRIIPILYDKGIDFLKYYVSENITVVEEKDFVFTDKDNINITKRQMGNILTALSLSDLNYDEKLYSAQIYSEYNQRNFNYSKDNFENSQKNILFEMCLEIDNPMQITEVLSSYFNKEDTKVILEELPIEGNDYRWNSKYIESGIENIMLRKLAEIKKLEEKVEEESKIINAIVYQNKCRSAVLEGTQILLQESSYNLDYMYGVSNVGKERTTQEDSYVMLNHPKDKKFKFLAVADGMGGHDAGEIVSNHVVKNLIYWFESLDPSLANDMNKAKELIESYLPTILNDLPEKARDGGTTLAAAMIGKTQTLIINSGDSRVYTALKDRLKQEIKDQSEAQYLYEEGRIVKEELMRFYKHNNRVTGCIRKDSAILDLPEYTIIPNTSYDKILLVTDGVSDCLSKEELEILIKTSKKEKVAENIVEAALNTDSIIHPKYSYDKIYNHQISGGKDNTTAVFYDAEEDIEKSKSR